MDNRGIGIFDSGFGGLTVLKEIKKILPGEKVYYFGDTARLPYGSKSRENIVNYSQEIAEFLKTKDIKALVIACNTASAMALEALQGKYDFPVIGVIGAGSRGALKVSSGGRIGVIGTKGTVNSGVYEREIKKIKADVEVYANSCPLFVPLVEEGMIEDEITKMVIERYLSNFKGRVDSLILGCTHYPILGDIIRRYLDGTGIEVVNPAIEVAKELKELLEEEDQLSDMAEVHDEFYVSDSPNHFRELGEMFLGSEIEKVQKINLEEYGRG
ncbi:glutamate racemase [Propionigenium maris DSM 9537]|uniref:Glutamate racemase n=1 Tax=Propionigenium maris DSM 9537 TaxID=1123000 RepID=A0A9W6GHW8_9FUSO|nr:glutamate racemase [Propionigenium maris]GLI55509.1 glutamate racemase [Propionigenium maris DSM 9537]